MSLTNSQVFSFLHFAEAALSLTCGLIHIFGLDDEYEPTSYEVKFLLIFFGLTLMSAVEIVLCCNKKFNVKREACEMFAGLILMFFASIMSMSNAENDVHIQYLTDKQEAIHRYFEMNKLQSIVSLASALMFLVHFLFNIDLLLISRTIFDSQDDTLKLDLPVSFLLKCKQQFRRR